MICAARVFAIFGCAAIFSAPLAANAPPICEKNGFIPQQNLGPLTAPNISIASIDRPQLPSDACRSSDGKRYFWVDNPDTIKEGPWSARLIAVGDEAAMSLSVDIIRGGLSPNWINERLIYVRVQFGRIYFSDLIIDVDTASFLHSEDVIYGCLDKTLR